MTFSCIIIERSYARIKVVSEPPEFAKKGGFFNRISPISTLKEIKKHEIQPKNAENTPKSIKNAPKNRRNLNITQDFCPYFLWKFSPKTYRFWAV